MSPPSQPDRKRIAIVDDDELVRVGMGSLLSSLGYAAEAFPSGPAFLGEDSHRFVCLITDLQMPGMSGLELQSELSARDARLPLIFMTASREDRARAEALSAGARGFFQKPCDLDALVNLIEAIVYPGSDSISFQGVDVAKGTFAKAKPERHENRIPRYDMSRSIAYRRAAHNSGRQNA